VFYLGVEMSYLYIIKCQDYHKIGIANDVEARLAQLATGNPYPLEVVVTYEFDNAEVVEKAIHQRYKENRNRGEWFRLSYGDLENIHEICIKLGGSAYEYFGKEVSDESMEEAESVSEQVDGAKWDFAQMFADGWRMEKQTNGRNVGGECKYWGWRRGSKNPKGYIYGGTLASLPHPIEEMRRIYAQVTP
jgi:hypothetical protein